MRLVLLRLSVVFVLGSASLSASAGFVWPNALTRIDRALASPSTAERRAAAEQLADLDAAVAAPRLVRALADADTEVRLNAAASARHVRCRQAADAVLSWLSDPDVRLRRAACEVLRHLPSDRAIGMLSRVLSDPDADVRQAAAAALGASGRSEAVGPLLGHLDDPASLVRAEVASALALIGDPSASVPLLGKVGDGAPEVRCAVVRALGDLGERRAASALILSLRDGVHAVRLAALRALGQLRVDETAAHLAPFLSRDANAELRMAAVDALGRIGSRSAVEVLSLSLSVEDVSFERSPVCAAMLEAGDAARRVLLDMLAKTRDATQAAGAALCLGAMKAEGAAAPIVDAMRHGRLEGAPALTALGRLGDPVALPFVLELVADRTEAVRKAALRAVVRLLGAGHSGGRAVDPLLFALRDPRASVEDRTQIVEALGRTEAARARDVLVALASSPKSALRLAAIDALGALGPQGQDAALLAALGDEDGSVRLRAALALSEVAAPSTAKVLVDRLLSSERCDRLAYGFALSGTLARGAPPEVLAVFESALAADLGPTARDALFEALGRSNAKEAGELLSAWVRRSADPADRAKIAESMAGHADQADALVSLLRDPSARVRAHALWALGSGPFVLGGLEPTLARLSADRDPDVAANAVAALALLAERAVRLAANAEAKAGPTPEGAPIAAAVPPLCLALADVRPYVRANALSGLALVGARCADGERERQRLLEDTEEAVRWAAARLLARTDEQADEAMRRADRRALARCAAHDRSGRVVAACRNMPRPVPSDVPPVARAILVMPDVGDRPLAEAPFALLRSDGLIRAGTADRRGVVFEKAAPAGPLSLVVPSALSF